RRARGVQRRLAGGGESQYRREQDLHQQVRRSCEENDGDECEVITASVSPSDPSPLWGGWPAEGRSGGGRYCHRKYHSHKWFLNPPPPRSLHSRRPSPQGGGIRKRPA